jgi:hypothetical protein
VWSRFGAGALGAAADDFVDFDEGSDCADANGAAASIPINAAIGIAINLLGHLRTLSLPSLAENFDRDLVAALPVIHF